MNKFNLIIAVLLVTVVLTLGCFHKEETTYPLFDDTSTSPGSGESKSLEEILQKSKGARKALFTEGADFLSIWLSSGDGFLIVGEDDSEIAWYTLDVVREVTPSYESYQITWLDGETFEVELHDSGRALISGGSSVESGTWTSKTRTQMENERHRLESSDLPTYEDLRRSAAKRLEQTTDAATSVMSSKISAEIAQMEDF